jgi:TP901 family phage tail tape measure protein
MPDIILTVGGDPRPLEQVIDRALNRPRRLGSLNVAGIDQPLGKITGKASEFSKSLEASNARVIAFGASAGAIAAVKIAFDKLLGSTIEVEKSLSDINAILNLSQKELSRFSTGLFEVANNTATSFGNAAKAAQEFSRQGLSAAETLERTRASLILSRLSGVDYADAVASITAALNSFNTESLTAIELVNRLATVDARFSVSAGDLAEGIKRVGSSASEANISLNETIALITTAQQTTARGGAVIGNSFKTIFTRLQRPEVISQLQEVGIATKDASGNALPLIDVLKSLARQYDNLSGSQRSSIAETVGGVYQINILKAVLQDLGNGVSVYDSALKTANNTVDDAIDRNNKLNQTISAKLTQTLNNFTRAAANVGNITLSPTLKGGLDTFGDLAKNIGDSAIGEGIGDKIFQGFLKSFGQLLSGPGVQLLTFTVLKLFEKLTRFAGDSFREFMGINQSAKDYQLIQQQVLLYLQKNPEILKEINRGTVTVEQAHQRILQSIRDENSLLAFQAKVAQDIALQMVKSGVRTSVTNLFGAPKTSAAGHVPAFAIEEASARRLGAPSSVRAQWGKGTIGGRPFIMNNHEKEITGAQFRAMGMPTRSGDSMVIPKYMRGWVPNFAKDVYTINGQTFNQFQIPHQIRIGKITPEQAAQAGYVSTKEKQTEKDLSKSSVNIPEAIRTLSVSDYSLLSYSKPRIPIQGRRIKRLGGHLLPFGVFGFSPDSVYPPIDLNKNINEFLINQVAGFAGTFGPAISQATASKAMHRAMNESKGLLGAVQSVVGGVFESGMRLAFGEKVAGTTSGGDFDIAAIPAQLSKIFKSPLGLPLPIGRKAEFKSSDSDDARKSMAAKILKDRLGVSSLSLLNKSSRAPMLAASGYIPNFASQKTIEKVTQACANLPNGQSILEKLKEGIGLSDELFLYAASKLGVRVPTIGRRGTLGADELSNFIRQAQRRPNIVRSYTNPNLSNVESGIDQSLGSMFFQAGGGIANRGVSAYSYSTKLTADFGTKINSKLVSGLKAVYGQTKFGSRETSAANRPAYIDLRTIRNAKDAYQAFKVNMGMLKKMGYKQIRIDMPSFNADEELNSRAQFGSIKFVRSFLDKHGFNTKSFEKSSENAGAYGNYTNFRIGLASLGHIPNFAQRVFQDLDETLLTYGPEVGYADTFTPEKSIFHPSSKLTPHGEGLIGKQVEVLTARSSKENRAAIVNRLTKLGLFPKKVIGVGDMFNDLRINSIGRIKNTGGKNSPGYTKLNSAQKKALLLKRLQEKQGGEYHLNDDAIANIQAIARLGKSEITATLIHADSHRGGIMKSLGYIPNFAQDLIFKGRNVFQSRWLKEVLAKKGVKESDPQYMEQFVKSAKKFAKKYGHNQGLLSLAGGFTPDTSGPTVFRGTRSGRPTLPENLGRNSIGVANKLVAVIGQGNFTDNEKIAKLYNKNVISQKLSETDKILELGKYSDIVRLYKKYEHMLPKGLAAKIKNASGEEQLQLIQLAGRELTNILRAQKFTGIKAPFAEGDGNLFKTRGLSGSLFIPFSRGFIPSFSKVFNIKKLLESGGTLSQANRPHTEGLKNLLSYIGFDYDGEITKSGIGELFSSKTNKKKLYQFLKKNPISVRDFPENHREISDGNHRFTLAQIAGIKNVPSLSFGYIPSFGVSEAINREKKQSGLPYSQIYAFSNKKLISTGNPLGIGVANKRDEPIGGYQGINRYLSKGLDPRNAGRAKGFIPNFADDGLIGGVGASGLFGLTMFVNSLGNVKGLLDGTQKLKDSLEMLNKKVIESRGAFHKAKDERHAALQARAASVTRADFNNAESQRQLAEAKMVAKRKEIVETRTQVRDVEKSLSRKGAVEKWKSYATGGGFAASSAVSMASSLMDNTNPLKERTQELGNAMMTSAQVMMALPGPIGILAGLTIGIINVYEIYQKSLRDATYKIKTLESKIETDKKISQEGDKYLQLLSKQNEILSSDNADAESLNNVKRKLSATLRDMITLGGAGLAKKLQDTTSEKEKVKVIEEFREKSDKERSQFETASKYAEIYKNNKNIFFDSGRGRSAAELNVNSYAKGVLLSMDEEQKGKLDSFTSDSLNFETEGQRTESLKKLESIFGKAHAIFLSQLGGNDPLQFSILTSAIKALAITARNVNESLANETEEIKKNRIKKSLVNAEQELLTKAIKDYRSSIKAGFLRKIDSSLTDRRIGIDYASSFTGERFVREFETKETAINNIGQMFKKTLSEAVSSLDIESETKTKRKNPKTGKEEEVSINTDKTHITDIVSNMFQGIMKRGNTTEIMNSTNIMKRSLDDLMRGNQISKEERIYANKILEKINNDEMRDEFRKAADAIKISNFSYDKNQRLAFRGGASSFSNPDEARELNTNIARGASSFILGNNDIRSGRGALKLGQNLQKMLGTDYLGGKSGAGLRQIAAVGLEKSLNKDIRTQVLSLERALSRTKDPQKRGAILGAIEELMSAKSKTGLIAKEQINKELKSDKMPDDISSIAKGIQVLPSAIANELEKVLSPKFAKQQLDTNIADALARFREIANESQGLKTNFTDLRTAAAQTVALWNAHNKSLENQIKLINEIKSAALRGGENKPNPKLKEAENFANSLPEDDGKREFSKMDYARIAAAHSSLGGMIISSLFPSFLPEGVPTPADVAYQKMTGTEKEIKSINALRGVALGRAGLTEEDNIALQRLEKRRDILYRKVNVSSNSTERDSLNTQLKEINGYIKEILNKNRKSPSTNDSGNPTPSTNDSGNPNLSAVQPDTKLFLDIGFNLTGDEALVSLLSEKFEDNKEEFGEMIYNQLYSKFSSKFGEPTPATVTA